MTQHNKGLAAIPLILGLALMIISTAVAVDLSRKNQNPQNRAADLITQTPVVPCYDFQKYFQEYCQKNYPTASNSGYVDCVEAESIIKTYCSSSPTISPVTPTTTKYPTPTIAKAITPAISRAPTSGPQACRPGETRTMGRFILRCVNGRWTITPVTTR